MQHTTFNRHAWSRRNLLKGGAASAFAVGVSDWPFVAQSASEETISQQLQPWRLGYNNWDVPGSSWSGIPVLSTGACGWISGPLIDQAFDSVVIDAFSEEDMEDLGSLHQVADGDLGSIAVLSRRDGPVISLPSAFLAAFRARFAPQPSTTDRDGVSRVALIASIMENLPDWVSTLAMAEASRRTGLETIAFLFRPTRDDFEDEESWSGYLSYRSALMRMANRVIEADVNTVLAVAGPRHPDDTVRAHRCYYLAEAINRFAV